MTQIKASTATFSPAAPAESSNAAAGGFSPRFAQGDVEQRETSEQVLILPQLRCVSSLWNFRR